MFKEKQKLSTAKMEEWKKKHIHFLLYPRRKQWTASLERMRHFKNIYTHKTKFYQTFLLSFFCSLRLSLSACPIRIFFSIILDSFSGLCAVGNPIFNRKILLSIRFYFYLLIHSRTLYFVCAWYLDQSFSFPISKSNRIILAVYKFYKKI